MDDSHGMTAFDLGRVDHLVYAGPDLDRAVERLAGSLGVRATPGGAHPGRGTRNALVALGPTSYLEIIGPDPDQPAPDRPRSFGIDGLSAARLVTWAANATDLERRVAAARVAGVPIGEVTPGRRRRPDGVELAWRSTHLASPVAEGIVPFLIDWGDTPHPARDAAPGLMLVGLRAEHPDPEPVRRLLAALGLALPVERGPTPALIATIQGPRGRVELR